MLARALPILLALAAVALPGPARSEIVGRATVIDGDTLQIEGRKVRLYGIDALETAQTCVARREWRCGIAAGRALEAKIADGTVACVERDTIDDGMALAACRLGKEDLAAWLVARGWAFADRARSSDYLVEEQNARDAGRGMWRGAVLAPWDWRVAQMARARLKGRAQGERMVLASLPSDTGGPRTVTVRAASNGHFHVDAVANGRRIPVIVDTGASVMALTRQDAGRIGLDVSRLSYTHHIQTANGVARAAPVTLRQVSVGPIVLADVEAIVIEGNSALPTLLGMSFLSRLEGYSVSGDALTMTAP